MLLLVGLAGCQQISQAEQFELIDLQVGAHRIQVQLADTPAKRSQGLMGQTPLTHGMLLLQEQLAPMVLWMKNTPESLEVAFLDEHWRIIAIRSMQANTELLHPSEQPVIAALEMPAGWFTERQIRPGAQVLWLSHLERSGSSL